MGYYRTVWGRNGSQWCSNADFLVNMSASADVLAQAKVELDLAAVPEGKNVRHSSSIRAPQKAMVPDFPN